jgi:glutamine cyclotransferase
MKKPYVAAAIFVLVLILMGLSIVFLGGFLPNDTSPNPSPTPTPTPTFPQTSSTPKPTATPTPTSTETPTTTPSTAPIYSYQIINTYPHDTSAFTEGLIFINGALFESTGGFGASYLKRVDLQTGNMLQQTQLSSEYFGEGLASVNGSLVQLTWLNHVGFVYDDGTLGLLGNFSYGREGWGLTYDGSRLIASDGSSNLYFFDPLTYQTMGQVSVKDGNTPVTNLNELEYINGDVYANVWHTQKIAIINPQTGQVKAWIDLTGIYQTPTDNPEAVLNGIAYDQNTGRLFVTGKDWPNLYEIRIVGIS